MPCWMIWFLEKLVTNPAFTDQRLQGSEQVPTDDLQDESGASRIHFICGCPSRGCSSVHDWCWKPTRFQSWHTCNGGLLCSHNPNSDRSTSIPIVEIKRLGLEEITSIKSILTGIEKFKNEVHQVQRQCFFHHSYHSCIYNVLKVLLYIIFFWLIPFLQGFLTT